MLPSPEEFWAVWPIPREIRLFRPKSSEGSDDFHRLASFLIDLTSKTDCIGINLDPYWAGYLLLEEGERRLWLGVFFQHNVNTSGEGIFSEVMASSFEIPPEFDERREEFLRSKSIYTLPERRLIGQFLQAMYAGPLSEEEWRYRKETMDFWSSEHD